MNLNNKQLELCLYAISYLQNHSDIITERQFNKISQHLERALQNLKSKSRQIDLEASGAIHLALNVLLAIANDEVEYNIDEETRQKCISNIDELNVLIYKLHNALVNHDM